MIAGTKTYKVSMTKEQSEAYQAVIKHGDFIMEECRITKWTWVPGLKNDPEAKKININGAEFWIKTTKTKE